jgi:glutamyl-tRNA synthetase
VGGRILMRLEDLDGPRARPEMAEAALRDLAWLGLDWDGPPYVQSSGLAEISAAAAELAERGLAYACVCSRGDIRSAQSAPQQGELEPRYPGTCRNRYASLEAALAETGKPAGLRLLVADGEVPVRDELLGELSFDVQGTVGDFLIAKRDHAPAYQLAVVVDDARQGVTEVVRGADLLESTARQRLLQEALGLPAVSYFHVPLVVDQSGRRLAKRHDDLSLRELREGGTDARAIVAWAARSCAIDCEDRVAARDILPLFSMRELPRDALTLSDAAMSALRGAR